MADCSKTVEFIRELVRLCSSNDCSDGCPLWENHAECKGNPNHSLDKRTMAIVQKWSDEHPVETWAGKIKELFPDADVCALTANACPGWIFGNGPNRYKQEWDCSADFSPECVICWNGEYKEAKV